MKEAVAHINTPALQNRMQPFFQRNAEENREDSAFFSGVQAKLSVAAKDDPYEKEADAMADKVVNKKTIQAKLSVGEKDDPYEKEADAMADKVVNKRSTDIQTKNEEQKKEEKKEPEDDVKDKPINKKAVADDEDNNENKVQRMCPECDEGDRIFRSGDPDISGMSKRDAVIAMARTMLGKIKAKQPGGGGERYGAKELWEIFKLAAPGIWSEETVKTFGQTLPSWCGIFSVWAHKKAGIDLGNWQMGKGVTAFGTLKQTTSPQPGDIGYIELHQHHCIVTKVNGNTIDSIDGNSGLFSEVIENTRQRTAYAGFFTAHSGAASTTISKKETEGKATTAPASVESSLASSKGGGTGLPEKTRSEMESGFGTDFSKVKIHTDSNAVQMNKQLNAQAFTHGGDIYFNESKYDTDSKTGKQLLAHELTHTVQQGASSSVQKKSTAGSSVIQKAPASTPDDAAKITAAKEKIEKQIKKIGIVEVKGTTFEITLYDFPLKQYANIIGTAKEPPSASPPAVELPKPGTRKTNQSKKWREEMAADIRESLKKNVLPAGLENEPDLELSLAGEVKENTRNTKLIGSFDVLAKEIIVPFWDMGGHPMIHQIEHKVDWQILGDAADTIPNLFLIDMGSNLNLGRQVQADLKSRIGKILDFYRDAIKITNLVPDVETAKQDYTIKIAGFTTSDTPTKSILSASNLRPTSGNNPINTRNVLLKRAVLPKKHLVFKTSKNGAGFILPYDFKNKYRTLVMKGEINPDTKEYELKTVTITRLIRDDKGVAIGGTEEVNLNFIKEKTDYYKLDQKGYAYSIKNKLKLKDLSPVILDDDPDLDPEKGVTATGKVESDISFLKDAKIDFGIENSNYFVRAVISPSFLKENKKIPKPFSIDYGSVIIEASTEKGLSIEGEVGFGIEKMGKGTVKIGRNSKGFNASGRFVFDKSVFDGQIGFKYENKKWTIEGDASMNGKKLKGVKNANIHFKYSEAEEVLIVGGSAHLSIPGISAITIDSKIGKEGDFEIKTGVDLEKIPRIKNGHVTVNIAKNKEGEWDLSITDAKIEPDLNYGGLTINSIKFDYAKGAYDISINAKYSRNKINAEEIEIGLTNKPVSADGKKQEGEPTKNMSFYGHLKLTVTVMEGDKPLQGTIESDLKPDGDITLDGKIELADNDIEIFSIKPLNKDLPPRLNQDIVLASCGVVTLSVNIAGGVSLYAEVKPLSIKKGSFIRIGNLSLKNYNDPHLEVQILLGSHLSAGVRLDLTVSLVVSLLLVLKGSLGIKGILDFVAIDADATGKVNFGWSATTGLQLKEASLSLQMLSKLVATLKGTARIYADLWLTEIDFWTHEWELKKVETVIASFFAKEAMEIPIEAGTDGKLKQPDTENKLAKVKEAGKIDKIKDTTNARLDGDGKTAADKRAEMQEEVKSKVKEIFTNPDRFDFNRSENYLETRYAVYDYLIGNMDAEQNLDLKWIPEFIIQCEHEEYERFSDYIIHETGFDDNAKAMIIEDFIVNHPTLYAGEIVNLRSLIPAKAAPSKKQPVKSRGGQKQRPASPVREKSKIQTKAKPGSSGAKSGKHSPKNRSQKNAAYKTAKENEFTEMEEAMPMTDKEFSIVNDFSNHDLENTMRSTTITDVDDKIDNNEDCYFKSFYMRPYTRTRRPLQQRADEKSKSPFFSGPEKKEKISKGAFFQAKSEAGGPDDKLEKEADKMADKVVAQKPPAETKKEEPPKTQVPGQEEQKDKNPVQKKEKETGAEKEKEEEGNIPISKKDNNAGTPPPKTNSVEAAITEKNGTGKRLPENTLKEMEHTFGNDFSDVNIHTGEEATELSQELDAQAFTQGKDIYFNQGNYSPDTSAGKHLLAHELTHVVQQGKGKSSDVQPYRDKSKTHFGTKDRGELKEDSFNKKNKKDKETKPWIKEINIDFTLEKKDDSGKLIPIGTATGIYEDNAAKLPAITIGVTGGSKELGKTRSGKFTVHRIEGIGYSDVPLSDGEGPNKKYAKPDAIGGFSASMHYAIFFDAGRALHTGALEESSHGCVHVDPGSSNIVQMNYHSVVGLTKVNVNFAPGLEKGVNKGIDINPTKTKIIEEFDGFISGARFADAVTKVQELPESDREVVLRTTSTVNKAEMYTASVQGTALDKFDALGNLTRSAFLDVNFRKNVKDGDWQKAAEFLNGFNNEDIKTRLLRLDKTERDKIHQGAIDNPAVGPMSQIAIMTTP